MASKKLSQPDIDEARRLRAEHHLVWSAIARRFGLSIEGLRRQIDPEYRASRNNYQRDWMEREARIKRSMRRAS